MQPEEYILVESFTSFNKLRILANIYVRDENKAASCDSSSNSSYRTSVHFNPSNKINIKKINNDQLKNNIKRKMQL